MFRTKSDFFFVNDTDAVYVYANNFEGDYPCEIQYIDNARYIIAADCVAPAKVTCVCCFICCKDGSKCLNMLNL